ncbi:hypothetical protein [Pedobacter sp. Leaf170]|nr:hypothetical protein [Pedobacter sp. Leaf170]
MPLQLGLGGLASTSIKEKTITHKKSICALFADAFLGCLLSARLTS